MSRVSSFLMNLRQQQTVHPTSTSSDKIETIRMIITLLLLSFGFICPFDYFSLQYFGGFSRLEQIVSTISSTMKLPRYIMLLTAIYGKLSNPRCTSLTLHAASVLSTGSVTLIASIDTFFFTICVHSSKLFQSPSQCSSKAFMQSIHFSAPFWLKIAYWCSCSLIIFWPTCPRQVQQSQLQYLVRQQSSLLQYGQSSVWQTTYSLVWFLSCLYSSLNCLRKTQVLLLAAEINRVTVLTLALGTGNLATISTIFNF